MTTDSERREVARRMREYADLPDDWWQETCAEFYIEKCAFGNVDRHSEAELFTRLADLIDPDCRNESFCKVCGHVIPDGWSECPRCKSKVVSDD